MHFFCSKLAHNAQLVYICIIRKQQKKEIMKTVVKTQNALKIGSTSWLRSESGRNQLKQGLPTIVQKRIDEYAKENPWTARPGAPSWGRGFNLCVEVQCHEVGHQEYQDNGSEPTRWIQDYTLKPGEFWGEEEWEENFRAGAQVAGRVSRKAYRVKKWGKIFEK